MRIDDPNRTPLTSGPGKTDEAASERALEKNSVTDRTDQADVSRLAQALSTSDPARLEQLRAQVQSGTYQVTSDALAKSLTKTHLKE
jgi:anti-sigma28 factor (negative regulator of flagellin synthesis)